MLESELRNSRFVVELNSCLMRCIGSMTADAGALVFTISGSHIDIGSRQCRWVWGLGFRVIYCSDGKKVCGLTDEIGWLGGN